MLSGVTHDFNNSLSGLLGHAELLNLKLDPAHPAAQHAQCIFKAILRTHPFLDFTQPQAKRNETSIVNAVIAVLKTLLVPTLGGSIEFKTELEIETLVTEIDGSHLQQALINLILNARDSMPLGGEMLFRTSIFDFSTVKKYWVNPAKEYVKVEVIDSGEGLNKGGIDHIFDPFYSTREAGKDSGLASLHSLVKCTAMRLVSTVKVDVGSSFTIILPCSNETLELHSN